MDSSIVHWTGKYAKFAYLSTSIWWVVNTWVLNWMYLWRRWASAYCSRYSSTCSECLKQYSNFDSGTLNWFALPLNDEGKTLAGWQRGNLGKPSPATNVRDSTWIITKIILATSFGRFVVRFWYMLECLQIKYFEGWKRRRHKAYFYTTLHLKSRYAKNLTWVDRARHLQCLESKPRCRQLPCSALSPSVATVTNKLSEIDNMIRRW